VKIPAISGDPNVAYHTPSSFVWKNNNMGLGFALDVPRGFNQCAVSGQFALNLISPPATTTSMEWGLFVRDGDDVQPLQSGTFDIDASGVSLARQGEFYRRVTDNRVQIAIGNSRVEMNNVCLNTIPTLNCCLKQF
jgi:hypothetical protein